jgi:hypothetical protein
MKQARLVEHLDIGGWKVAHMALPMGASYHAIVTGNRTRAEVGYVSAWIAGCIVGRNLTTGETLAERAVGVLSSDLPPMSVGRLEFTATEDTEWLCFDGKLNDGWVPELRVVEDTASAIPPAQHIEHQLAPGFTLVVPIRSM